MARYQTIVNVWDPAVDRSKLQPGQWVECGKGGERGIWCGQHNAPYGSDVVALMGNVRNRTDPDLYIRNLFAYARAK
jgi:hypothetical protein